MANQSTVTPESFNRVQYRADIDGLRAVAILAVLFFHAYPSSISGGFVGVDIFFVISGYLISGIIFRGLKRGTFSFFDFYARRVRRIFPAVIVVFTITLIIAYFLLTPYELRELMRETPYAAFFLENWRLYSTTGGYWDTATELKPLMHFWSLAVEEQYYIIYPLLCFCLWRFKSNKFIFLLTLIGGGSFLFNIYDTYNEPTRAFFSLHTRWWELSIGGWLAAVEHFHLDYKEVIADKICVKEKTLSNVVSFVGLILLGFAIIFLQEGKYFPGYKALLPTVGSCLVIMAGSKAIINKYILANPICVFIGLISYPLYLWHWPLISIVRNNLGGELPTGWLMIGILATSFVLAYLTYTLVERPMRTKKANLLLVGTLVFFLTVLIFGTAYMERTTRKDRYSEVPITVQEIKHEKVRGSDKRCRRVFGNGHTVCRTKGRNPSVLVMGDSHAYWLWNAVKKSNPKEGVYVVGNAGGPVHYDSYRGSYYRSAKQLPKIWKQIRTNPAIKTVVLVGYWRADIRELNSYRYKDINDHWLIFQKHWEDTLNELQKLNKKVIIVLDNIKVNYEPIDKCFNLRKYSFVERKIDDCRVPLNLALKSDKRQREYLHSLSQKWTNVTIVDSWDGLCDKEYCHLVENGQLLYRDAHHLSTNGSLKVWPLIENAINKQ